MAISLQSAVADYLNLQMSAEQISRRANVGDFPFPCYKADPTNKKSAWFVSIEALATWLHACKTEADKDFVSING